MTAGRKTMLVVGASGVVGRAAIERFSQLDGWEVIGVSRRPHGIDGAVLHSLDLLDTQRCAGTVRGDAGGDPRDLRRALRGTRAGVGLARSPADAAQSHDAAQRARSAASGRARARLVVARHKGVRRPSRGDAGAGARAVATASARELLLPAGGLPARRAARRGVDVHDLAPAGRLRRVVRQPDEFDPRHRCVWRDPACERASRWRSPAARPG